MSTAMPSILCVTPNPAVDRTHVIPSLIPGEVHRSYNVVVDAGGKGINVARAVKVLGGRAICAGFLGGLSGQIVANLVAVDRLQSAWTWIEGETRTCIIISTEDCAESTVFNEHGPTVAVSDWLSLREDVVIAAKAADAVCISGSIPAGAPIDSLPGLIGGLLEIGKSVWVDTSKSALQSALAAHPTAIKINHIEAGEVAGVDIQTPTQAVEVANQFCAEGVSYTIVTLGRHGAVLVNSATDGWWARPPVLQTVSAVGSGDCFLAGMVLAFCRGESLATALMHGVAAGTANALGAGGARFTQGQFSKIVKRVKVEPVN